MSEIDFYLGQSDTAPVLEMVLYDPAGLPVDLTGATVTFQIHRTTAPRTFVEGAATIVGSPTDGRIQYHWGATDAAAPGLYDARAKAVLGNGDLMSFPNYRTLKISVTADP